MADVISKTVNALPNTTNTTSRHITPALGLAWSKMVTTRVMLTRSSFHRLNDETLPGESGHESVLRRMEIIFAPHLSNDICYYYIDHQGIKGVGS